MPSSSATKQTADVLDDVLQIIRQEYEKPYPILCETDRNKFVEEEESLRERLKGTIGLDANRWRDLFCLPSPQAVKCLKNAEELRQRVKEDINMKLRTRLVGKSNPPPSPSWHGQNSGTSKPETELPPAEGRLRPASTVVTSPLNMRRSFLEPRISEVNSSLAVADDSSPLEVSSRESGDRSSSSSRRRRRSPPPPPLRRMTLSSNSRHSSEISSNSSNDSSRRSFSVRRPAPPPPQSPRQLRTPISPTSTSSPSSASSLPDPTIIPLPSPPRRRAPLSGPYHPMDTSSYSASSPPRRSTSVRRPAPPPPQSPRQSRSPHSPTNTSFLSSGPLPPDPDMISSISRLARHVNTLASSMATESSSRRGQGQRLRRSDYVSKTNCLEISSSTVDGVTLNNGGSHNSGAVIHKTMTPPRVAQHTPAL